MGKQIIWNIQFKLLVETWFSRINETLIQLKLNLHKYKPAKARTVMVRVTLIALYQSGTDNETFTSRLDMYCTSPYMIRQNHAYNNRIVKLCNGTRGQTCNAIVWPIFKCKLRRWYDFHSKKHFSFNHCDTFVEGHEI